jgi:hypothetical protein
MDEGIPETIAIPFKLVTIGGQRRLVLDTTSFDETTGRILATNLFVPTSIWPVALQTAVEYKTYDALEDLLKDVPYADTREVYNNLGFVCEIRRRLSVMPQNFMSHFTAALWSRNERRAFQTTQKTAGSLLENKCKRIGEISDDQTSCECLVCSCL